MADNTPVAPDREQARSRDLNDPRRYDSPDETPGVNVYDRPVGSRVGSGNMLTTILIVLVVLALVYFVFQWLF
jgi:hypothetical protein